MNGARSGNDAYDVVVIGGGIVGLATAHAVLTEHPQLRLALLEKEPGVARHQTGRNSGVIHSGIYYRPGSLKASTAVAGRLAMEQFCSGHGVPFERCGKVIVAVDPRELPRLAELERRAEANGVNAERISLARLRELEPHVRGVAALHVPDTGIVDFAKVSEALAESLRAAGADLQF
ncbi:MAG: FAD-dependent oxidoreductase, partial [Acidimicrobiia bacterium]